MKTFIFALLLSNNLLIIQIYGENAGFFDGIWTKNDIKFIMVQIVVVLVSISYLFKSEDHKNPTFWTLVFMVALNVVSVVTSYEISIDKQASVGFSMCVSFAVGLFSFPLVNTIMEKLPILANKVMDKLPDVLLDKIKKILG